MHEHPPGLDGVGTNTERIVFFSDAVFAIAITLLTLEIRVPELPASATSWQHVQSLMSIWPHVLTFVISFLVIGAIWEGHHRMFAYINRYNSGLIWTNLILLMFIAFMPVPTALLGNAGTDLVSVIFYAAMLTITALMSCAVWRYAVRYDLVVDSLDRNLKALLTLRPLLTALMCAISIPVAFFSPLLASLMWTLTFFARRTADSVYTRHQQKQRL